jgi:hypothetical protein
MAADSVTITAAGHRGGDSAWKGTNIGSAIADPLRVMCGGEIAGDVRTEFMLEGDEEQTRG